MKTLLILSFLLFSTHLSAYSKKIIFASYANEKEANNILKKLPKKIKHYEEVVNLSKKYNFRVHLRSSGKYTILVAEPFTNKKVLKKVLKIIKPYYKHAYYNNYTAPKIVKRVATKRVKKEEIQATPKVIKELKDESVKTESNKSVQKVQKRVIVLTPIEVLQGEERTPQTVVKPLKRAYSETTKADEENFAHYFRWYYILFSLFIVAIFYQIVKFRKLYDEF